jgi:hypothetical protein
MNLDYIVLVLSITTFPFSHPEHDVSYDISSHNIFDFFISLIEISQVSCS